MLWCGCNRHWPPPLRLTGHNRCHRPLAFRATLSAWRLTRAGRPFLTRREEPMLAAVRTGGQQYRAAPGDKIVVEKLAGEAGDQVDITDVLLAGEGSDLKSVDGLKVAAEIIAQAKGDKVTVFKKRRRHNYRRKKGHRQ